MRLFILIEAILADSATVNDLPSVVVAPDRLLTGLTGWRLVIMLFILVFLLTVRAAPDLVLLVPRSTLAAQSLNLFITSTVRAAAAIYKIAAAFVKKRLVAAAADGLILFIILVSHLVVFVGVRLTSLRRAIQFLILKKYRKKK